MSMWMYCPDCKDCIDGMDSCHCGWKEPPSPTESTEYRDLESEVARLECELAELRAKGSASLPDGWVAVPTRATEQMWEATLQTSKYVSFDRFEIDWEQMIDARPTHPNTTPTEDRTDVE